MAKRRPATRRTFDPATRERLAAIGPNQPDFGPDGYWSIRFGPILGASPGLPEFEVLWSSGGTARPAPGPDDELFALWERYRAAHRELCPEYRQVLLELLSRSSQCGQYTDRMWRTLRRKPPSERDMTGVVDGATLEIEQRRMRGESATTYEMQVWFEVYWDEHGVTVGVRERNGRFEVLGG